MLHNFNLFQLLISIMNCAIVILLAILVIILLVIVTTTNKHESFMPYAHLMQPFNSIAGMQGCEFNQDCFTNNVKWTNLSNGMEGVCTQGGIACPAFSKDHYDEMKRLGLL